MGKLFLDATGICSHTTAESLVEKAGLTIFSLALNRAKKKMGKG